MTVTVKLFATLRTGRFDVEVRDYSEGATVGVVHSHGNTALEEALAVVDTGLEPASSGGPDALDREKTVVRVEGEPSGEGPEVGLCG